MACPLFCELILEREKATPYWWPLIFEAMSWNSFQFTAPGQPEGIGYYYFIRKGNETETDFVRASFRATWDEIAADTSDMLISFWPKQEAAFALSVSVREPNANQRAGIVLSLEDAETLDLPSETVKHRISLTLACAKALYAISQPCTGTMFWEDSFGPLLSFDQPLDPAMLSPSLKQRVKVVEEPLPDGHILSRVEPFPVLVRGGWEWFSLEESTSWGKDRPDEQ